MDQSKRPVWAEDKYKTNAEGFRSLIEWSDKAEAYMDAQAEIVKGLRHKVVRHVRDLRFQLRWVWGLTRESNNRLAQIDEQAETIKRLRQEMIEQLESSLMYEQDACLNTSDTEQRIRDLRAACLKEEKCEPTKTDESAE